MCVESCLRRSLQHSSRLQVLSFKHTCTKTLASSMSGLCITAPTCKDSVQMGWESISTHLQRLCGDDQGYWVYPATRRTRPPCGQSGPPVLPVQLPSSLRPSKCPHQTFADPGNRHIRIYWQDAGSAQQPGRTYTAATSICACNEPCLTTHV